MDAATFPERVARGRALAMKESPPVHAAYYRYDSDHSKGVRTACGRTLYVPLEYAPETHVNCVPCQKALDL